MNIMRKFVARWLTPQTNQNTVLTCNTVDNYYADLVCVEAGEGLNEGKQESLDS